MTNKNISNKYRELVSRHWGFEKLYPFQEKNIAAVIEGKDSLTVMPTGGGKSLCYQLPAVIIPGTAVVISPLISLMKDQVDSLREMGIAADYLNSTLSGKERFSVRSKLKNGEVDILYIAPERLEFEGMLSLLEEIKLAYFVVDEAHCISHWGHDFRESYRTLSRLKKKFPQAAVHGFTATATKPVRQDILKQLNLEDPAVYMGNVDRDNITYRVRQRHSLKKQVVDLLEKHEDEAGIIYCLRRRDVDRLSDMLIKEGFDVLPYHAGMTDGDRKKHQERFLSEETDIIVATVAFGMGIDRSNIRFIIHATMPKSLEHYHQETGRAGRDGLPSFCYLLFSGGDYGVWKSIIKNSNNKKQMENKLSAIYRYCTYPKCRHKFLVEYFDQEYNSRKCEACDYCLGELKEIDKPLIIGQKILSCVARTEEKFGAGHIIDVLKEKNTDKVKRWGHYSLSTFGLMEDCTRKFIRDMIEQLVGQEFLKRGENYGCLKITKTGWELLRGEQKPNLIKPFKKKKKKKAKKTVELKLKDEDRELFEKLRAKRTQLARSKKVPAFVIFPDRSLHGMATKKPVTPEDFKEIHGVGKVKLKKYGEEFTQVIKDYLN